MFVSLHQSSAWILIGSQELWTPQRKVLNAVKQIAKYSLSNTVFICFIKARCCYFQKTYFDFNWQRYFLWVMSWFFFLLSMFTNSEKIQSRAIVNDNNSFSLGNLLWSICSPISWLEFCFEMLRALIKVMMKIPCFECILKGTVCSGTQFCIWFVKNNSSKSIEILETR